METNFHLHIWPWGDCMTVLKCFVLLISPSKFANKYLSSFVSLIIDNEDMFPSDILQLTAAAKAHCVKYGIAWYCSNVNKTRCISQRQRRTGFAKNMKYPEYLLNFYWFRMPTHYLYWSSEHNILFDIVDLIKYVQA